MAKRRQCKGPCLGSPQPPLLASAGIFCARREPHGKPKPPKRVHAEVGPFLRALPRQPDLYGIKNGARRPQRRASFCGTLA
jgi:hypothetical protein